MAAKRCSTCNINYPVQGHSRCYGCGSRTSVVGNLNPDADWRELAAVVRERLEESSTVGGDIVITESASERDGHFFLSSWAVYNSGYNMHLHPETEILVEDVRYIVGGYSYDRREYWILREEESG